MDLLAQLVDENGQIQSKDNETDQNSTQNVTEEAPKLLKLSNQMETETNRSFKDLFENRKKVFTEIEKKKCLEYTVDSGFWCNRTIGKLQIRYHYERRSRTCQCFLYYGCYGNTNNFVSPLECKDECKQFGFDTNKTVETTDCVINP